MSKKRKIILMAIFAAVLISGAILIWRLAVPATPAQRGGRESGAARI